MLSKLRAAVGTPRSLCPGTQKNKAKYGGETDKRLLPTKSDLSVASPSHAGQRQWKPVIRAMRKLILEHLIVANLYKNTLVHKNKV